MKNGYTNRQQTTRGILVIAFVTALGMAVTVAAPHAAHDDRFAPPPMPSTLRVLPPNEGFLVGHAVGTQNYVCLPSAGSVAWSLFTPEATLFDDHGKQLITHFFSPNPAEGNVVRATWQDSRDSSIVWARVKELSTDSHFVAPGAIPWVLLEVAGAQEGQRGPDELAETSFIQRLNTVGGAAPRTGCLVSTDIGHEAFVPYTADYFFYKLDSH